MAALCHTARRVRNPKLYFCSLRLPQFHIAALCIALCKFHQIALPRQLFCDGVTLIHREPPDGIPVIHSGHPGFHRLSLLIRNLQAGVRQFVMGQIVLQADRELRRGIFHKITEIQVMNGIILPVLRHVIKNLLRAAVVAVRRFRLPDAVETDGNICHKARQPVRSGQGRLHLRSFPVNQLTKNIADVLCRV